MLEPTRISNNLSFAWQLAIIVFFIIVLVAWVSSETSERHKKEEKEAIILQAMVEMECRMDQKMLEMQTKFDELKKCQDENIIPQNAKLDQIISKLESIGK